MHSDLQHRPARRHQTAPPPSPAPAEPGRCEPSARIKEPTTAVDARFAGGGASRLAGFSTGCESWWSRALARRAAARVLTAEGCGCPVTRLCALAGLTPL